MDSSPGNLELEWESDTISRPPLRAIRKKVSINRKAYHSDQSSSKFANFVKENVLNEYKHTPLLQPDDIRVLVLHAGNPEDTIHCSFRVVSLRSVGTRYEALSYYWGTDEPSRRITIRAAKHKAGLGKMRAAGTAVIGQKFHVRNNLYDALHQLRLENRDCALWVDGLCIDQENEKEKSEQVLQMAKIYSKADNVCVWLGEGNQMCAMGMDFVAEVINLNKFDNLTGNDTSTPKWTALVELMRCQWFSRRWVVQELALARDATLHYGDKAVVWSDFADAVALLVKAYDAIKKLFHKSTEYNNDPDYLGDIKALGANILVDISGNIFRKSANGEKTEPLFGLEALVADLTRFEASDPKDTIYALLSIAQDTAQISPHVHHQPEQHQIIPDYSKTKVQVYKDFTEFCIKKSNSLDIICRHWAPAGRRSTATGDHPRTRSNAKESTAHPVKLPSWVPLLSESTFGNPEDAPNGRVNGDSLVGHPDHKHYNAAAGLPAEVRFEDVEVDIFSVPKSRSSIDSHNKRSGSITSSIGALTKEQRSYLWVTGFQIDVIKSLSARIAGGLLLQECLQMGGWNGFENTEMDQVPEPLWRTLVAGRDPVGRNPPSWYHRACLTCFARMTPTGDINTNALINHQKSSSIMVEFLKRVQSVVTNRKFLLSAEKGYFGLAPKEAKKSDIICILYGLSVPVILREHKPKNGEPTYYELIGESFIYGMMDGEAIYKALPTKMIREYRIG